MNMENVSRETIKLPKWILVLMAVAFFIIPFGSASASTTPETSIPTEVKGQRWVYMEYDYGGQKVLFSTSDPTIKFKIARSGTLWAGFDSPVAYTAYKWNGTQFVHWFSEASGTQVLYGGSQDSYSVKASNMDIYKAEDMSVFFSATVQATPTPTVPNPVVAVETVEEIPETIVANLHGGLLGMGLTILAVMLGVSLIPRLILYFNR